MAKDFAFDPVTQDLVPDGEGGFKLTDNADTMMQHQALCHAGKCWQDPTLGSYLYDMRRFQANPEKLLPDEMKRCFGVLVARGRLSNLEVTAERKNAGRVDVATKSRDTSTGQPISNVFSKGA